MPDPSPRVDNEPRGRASAPARGSEGAEQRAFTVAPPSISLTADTLELKLMFEQLKRAAIASGRAIGPADEAAADDAIRDVGRLQGGGPHRRRRRHVRADHRDAHRPHDVRDRITRSSAAIVEQLARGRWTVGAIDVSLAGGRANKPIGSLP